MKRALCILAAVAVLTTPDLVDDTIARVRELVDSPTSPSDDFRDRLRAQIEAAERQVGRLTEAIASTRCPLARWWHRWR